MLDEDCGNFAHSLAETREPVSCKLGKQRHKHHQSWPQSNSQQPQAEGPGVLAKTAAPLRALAKPRPCRNLGLGFRELDSGLAHRFRERFPPFLLPNSARTQLSVLSVLWIPLPPSATFGSTGHVFIHDCIPPSGVFSSLRQRLLNLKLHSNELAERAASCLKRSSPCSGGK